MLPLEEREDVVPVCPHCTAKVTKLAYRELGGVFGKRFIYFCAHCLKVLGVSHRKGFWMG